MDPTSSGYISSCTLYDILGVDSDATAEDVRKAYRKLALKWHPDKQNQVSDVERQLALETFRQVSNAYEILSDDRERQWYDAKLRRLQKSSSSQIYSQTFPEDFPEISSVISSREYMNGCFTLEEYLPLFKKIASMERSHGHSCPDYQGCPVQVFYAEWGSFASSLDFSWINEPISRNLDRRMRRMIEQEHAKARRQARKEYNESIRTFTEFCKKRDPAYIEWYSLYQKSRIEQVKETVSKSQKREQRQNQEQRRENEEERIEVEFEDVSYDAWYCPACEKYFKSEGSFRSHEMSKKHIKNVEIMKHMLMLEEDFVHMDLHIDKNKRFIHDGVSIKSGKKKNRKKKEKGWKEKKEGHEETKTNNDKEDNDSLLAAKATTRRRRRKDKSKINTIKPPSLCCNVCNEEFPSRNQLFCHIKDTGHACQVS